MSDIEKGQQQQVEVGIQRIYIKDLSFESPNAPHIFTKSFNPQIQLDINTTSEKISDHTFEVSLAITATAKSESEVLFIAEVEQCGIFTIKGAMDQSLKQILGSYCPSILFPYIREAIDSLTTKGSFPPLMLAPINFDALYNSRTKN